MSHIGNTIRVKSRGFYIKFSCDAGGIYSREVTFGELSTGDNGEDSSDDEDGQQEYSHDFDAEQLSRIIKISGLSGNMQIYPCEGNPLLFKSLIGGLGKISIYIKSKEQIELDDLQEDHEDEN